MSTSTRMFIALLFIIAKKLEKPKLPLRINCYIHRMLYYPTMKLNELQSHAIIQIALKIKHTKTVTTTLYARQQKRHRREEQTFGLCGRRWGWDDLREQHWNMYITICKTDGPVPSWMHEAGHPKLVLWDNPEGWGGRWKGGSGWGDTCTHVIDSCWCMAKTTIIL